MENELALIGVIDTAVKIGLGAIISAVSGYLILHQTQKGQVDTEYREEKRKYIGELLGAIGYISSQSLAYWSYINDHQINLSKGMAISEETENKLNESHRKFHASFEKITLLEGKYFVVAGDKKYQELTEYAQFLARFHFQGAFGAVENLQTWPKREKKMRVHLLESIHGVYIMDKNT